MDDLVMFSAVRQAHSDYLGSLKARLLTFVDGEQLLTNYSVKRFTIESQGAAQNSAERINQLIRASGQRLSSEQSLKAILDAGESQSKLVRTEAYVDEQSVYALLLSDALAASSILRKVALNQRLLHSKGLRDGAIRIRVREWFRREFGNLVSYKGSRFQSKRSWLLYLAARGSLVNTMVESYMTQASALGFTNFEIVQQGHRRHGMKFDMGSLPAKEFHPQSSAKLILVR